MKRVRLKTWEVVDRASFHEVFKKMFGFPEWYGANMDAWIDCKSDLDDGCGLTQFKLEPGEMLVLEVLGTEAFFERMPEVLADLVACTAHANQRYLKRVGSPILNLAFS